MLTLNNVHFGDVWVCSGQSNMYFNVSRLLNREEEIAHFSEYPNIRMFKVKMMTASQPQDDLMEYDDNFNKWANVNEREYILQFSAVCLLTARYMADVLGKNKVSHPWLEFFTMLVYCYFFFRPLD